MPQAAAWRRGNENAVRMRIGRCLKKARWETMSGTLSKTEYVGSGAGHSGSDSGTTIVQGGVQYLGYDYGTGTATSTTIGSLRLSVSSAMTMGPGRRRARRSTAAALNTSAYDYGTGTATSTTIGSGGVSVRRLRLRDRDGDEHDDRQRRRSVCRHFTTGPGRRRARRSRQRRRTVCRQTTGSGRRRARRSSGGDQVVGYEHRDRHGDEHDDPEAAAYSMSA